MSIEPVLARAFAEYERGRYRDARRILEQTRLTALSTAAKMQHAALLAELLHLTGDYERAAAQAENAAKRSDADPAVRSECLNVLGSLSLESGDYAKAVQQFQSSLALARDTGDLGQIARTQLRLMSALADRNPDAVVAALWAGVRQNVLRLGNPNVTVLFHITHSRLQARSGLADRAKRHLDVAASVLTEHPNIGLEGVLHLDASALYGLIGERRRAIEHASTALRLSKESGHEKTLVSALGNLGVLLVQVGELADAEGHLSSAVALSARLAETRAALHESLAQLYLMSGNEQGCEVALEKAIEALPKRGPLTPSWYEVSLHETRIRLAMSRGEWKAGLNLALSAVDLCNQRSDSVLGIRFRAMAAEAAFFLGDRERALQCVSELLPLVAADPSPTTVALSCWMLAKSLKVLGDTDAACLHLGRAMRIARILGDAWLQWDLKRDPDFVRWTASATQGGIGSGKAQDVGEKSPDIPTLAGLLDVAQDPEVLATEASRILLASGAVERVEVTRSTSETGSVAGHSKPGSDKQPTSIHVGSTGGGRYSIEVIARPAVSSKATVLAVQRLVTAARELHAFRQAEKERTSLWPVEADADTPGGIVASTVMRDLYEMVDRLARADVPVLVTGETGVGKELVSRELHRRGHPASSPFVAYNCSAVPKDMLDAQLFGHKRGAFTGAHENFPGVIRAAAGGTLLLDEIGELSPEIQPKLLRFLESAEIHPIGEPRPLKVAVRIVAATNADLDRLVREGRFREDLFYRLNVVPLRVPPLRERREEIPALAEHFLERYAQDMRKTRLRMSDETLEYLVLYRWPGNVRQLANEIRRVVALAPGGAELAPAMLSDEIRASRRTIDASQAVAGPNEMVIRVDQPLSDAVAQLEWTMIERALAHGGDRLEDAASTLGISRKGLFLKRKRLGLLRRAARHAAGPGASAPDGARA